MARPMHSSMSALPAWATLGRQRPQLLFSSRTCQWALQTSQVAACSSYDARRFASTGKGRKTDGRQRAAKAQPSTPKQPRETKFDKPQKVSPKARQREDPSRRGKARAKPSKTPAASKATKEPPAPPSFLDKLRAIKVQAGSSVSSFLSGAADTSVPLSPPVLSSLSSSLAAPYPPERSPLPEAPAEVGDFRPTTAPYARPPLSSQPNDPLAYVTSAAMYRSAAPSAWDPTEDFEMMSKHEEMSMFERAYRRGRMEKRQYVSVIVDGDNLQFLPSLIRHGREGGQEADRLIRQQVLSDVIRSNPLNAALDDIRISVFANYSGLTNVVAGFGSEATERRAQWADFVQGLTLQPGTLFVGVGRLPQAADLKVKTALLQSVLDANCVQSYLGGLDDFGYAIELTALRKLNLLQRVSLLNVPGVAVRSKFYADYASRQVQWASNVFVGANDANREYRSLDKGVKKTGGKEQ